MRKELFRKQAIEAAKDSMFGKPINMTTPGILSISISLLIIAVIIGLYIYFGEFRRTETVTGVLKPTSGQSVMRVSSGGIIKESPIELGQYITAGTTIVRIERPHYSGESGNDMKLEADNLKKRLAIISERIELKTNQQSLQALHIQNRLERLTDRKAQVQSRLELNAQAQELTARRLDRAIESRAKGLNTIDELDNEKLAHIDQLHEQLQLNEELETLTSEQQELIDELDMHRTGHQIEIKELRERGLELEDRLRALRAESVTLIKAPIDGYISIAPPPAGHLVSANDLITIIRPDLNELEARVFVPNDAIGFIDVGQRVNLRFDAFPYQRFGSGSGHVVAIENSALGAEDIDAPISAQQGQTLYPVTIKLDDTRVTTQGVPIRLRSDLTLQADIVLDRVRIHEWLLDPLYRLRGRLENP